MTDFLHSKLEKIPLRWISDLKIEGPTPTGVKAASGLVKSGDSFFVIADDELSLFQFSFDGSTKMYSLSLSEGTLAIDPKERKRQKPDWEALVKIEIKNHPDVLLAIPSGSTENRMSGAFVLLDHHGLIDQSQQAVAVDFSEIYSLLKEKLTDLNIEGACIFNNKLKLFQRGNGVSGINAVVDIQLDGFCSDLTKRIPISPKHILSIETFVLGQLNGFKLDFTDACTLNDKIWFLAAAEDSRSTYDDGQYNGAILGCLDSNGKEIKRYEIDCPAKPEGLWVELKNQTLNFYVVTDADSAVNYAAIYLTSFVV